MQSFERKLDYLCSAHSELKNTSEKEVINLQSSVSKAQNHFKIDNSQKLRTPHDTSRNATMLDQDISKPMSAFSKKSSAKKQQQAIPVIATSLKNLKKAENYFTSPTDLKDVKRVKQKRNAKAHAQGQVQPKITVASPAIEERTTTNEKIHNEQANASSISSIKPYGDRIEHAEDTDMSATRFVCNHTTSPSKVSPEKSGVRSKKRIVVVQSE